MAACPRIKAAKAKSVAPSSKPTWSTAWSLFPASSFIQLRSPFAFGLCQKTSVEVGKSIVGTRTLFIDARELGTIQERKYRVLSDEEITRIVSAYQSWCGNTDTQYVDVPGFCASATTAQIAALGFKLTPAPFVGAPEIEADETPFEEKMEKLCSQLSAQLKASAKLESLVHASLKSVGYEV
jgi:type I restriction-modification system DNA methylase subunit